MGFDVNGTRFLIAAQKCGVVFNRTATIGRQSLQLDAPELQRVLAEFDFAGSAREATTLLSVQNEFAEDFLRLLGADVITSIDASPYEGASVVHDMNSPIPGDLKSAFNAVIDGGTLEHVFNFPVAIKNAMEMVRLGGHYLGITPANNFMGHGFYQFSPELYFRVFSPQNGFAIERMFIFEEGSGSKWYEVSDPENARKRVELVNSRPTYLLIQARKTSQQEIFSTVPQQSDYVSLWNTSSAEPANGRPRNWSQAIKACIPAPLRNAYRRVLQFHPSLKESPLFRTVNNDDLRIKK